MSDVFAVYRGPELVFVFRALAGPIYGAIRDRAPLVAQAVVTGRVTLADEHRAIREIAEGATDRVALDAGLAAAGLRVERSDERALAFAIRGLF